MNVCEICGQGPNSTVPVCIYRTNAEGQPEVWRCYIHLNASTSGNPKEATKP